MRVIRCDLCGKDINSSNGHLVSDFIEYEKSVDLCEECYNAYYDFESAYQQEYHALLDKFNEGVKQLNEEYKKLRSKYQKTS